LEFVGENADFPQKEIRRRIGQYVRRCEGLALSMVWGSDGHLETSALTSGRHLLRQT
jgi:hypothetical protein